MWHAIMEAGRDFGIAPFGLEAQRILRLEKGHVIVGQDTDATSTPLNAGSEWAVRFDKDDFIGRDGLAIAAARGPREQLVGFVMPNGDAPEDGTPVLSRRSARRTRDQRPHQPHAGHGIWPRLGAASLG